MKVVLLVIQLNIIIILFVILGGLSYKVFANRNAPLTNHYHDSHSHKTPPEDPIVQSDGSIILPSFDVIDSSVKDFGFDYTISGTIQDVIDTSVGKEIKLANMSENTPPLKISPFTEIYYGDSYLRKTASASADVLVPGTKAKFLVLYFFKTERWLLKYIFIPAID